MAIAIKWGRKYILLISKISWQHWRLASSKTTSLLSFSFKGIKIPFWFEYEFWQLWMKSKMRVWAWWMASWLTTIAASPPWPTIQVWQLEEQALCPQEATIHMYLLLLGTRWWGSKATITMATRRCHSQWLWPRNTIWVRHIPTKDTNTEQKAIIFEFSTSFSAIV